MSQKSPPDNTAPISAKHIALQKVRAMLMGVDTSGAPIEVDLNKLDAELAPIIADDWVTEDGFSFMSEVVDFGRDEAMKPVIEHLVAKGCPVDGLPDQTISPLVVAMHDQKNVIARALIENGADIHRRYDFGQTLLHKALEFNNMTIAGLLLDYPVDVNLTNKSGEAALMYAATFEYLLHLNQSTMPNGAPDYMDVVFEMFFPAKAIVKKMVSQGAYLDEFSRVQSNYAQEQFEAAHKRFNEWSADRDITQITAQDLVWFSNIGTLHELLKPELWRGHEKQLSDIVEQAPYTVQQAVLSQSGLSVLINNPDTVVSNAQELVPGNIGHQQGRG